MAYDKVVDSAVLDAGLKIVADAIRAKGGTTDNLEFPTAMAEAIEAGGGGGKILGHTFAAGSFTLAADTAEKHTVLTAAELFDAIKEDFPGATGLTNNIWITGSEYTYIHNLLLAICWIDRSSVYNADTGTKELLCGVLPKFSLSSSTSVYLTTDSYGNPSAKSAMGVVGISYSDGFTIGFGASYMGYAGSKYNWLVVPFDHGAVV